MRADFPHEAAIGLADSNEMRVVVADVRVAIWSERNSARALKHTLSDFAQKLAIGGEHLNLQVASHPDLVVRADSNPITVVELSWRVTTRSELELQLGFGAGGDGAFHL